MSFKVGDVVLVTYEQKPYKVKDYETTIIKVISTIMLSPWYQFKAPNAEQGNPHGGLIWSLEEKYLKLKTPKVLEDGEPYVPPPEKKWKTINATC